ncbi:MAG: hypothetical protein ABSD29_03010 [Verrucomicrobiota bacterium]|jgi:hypothetical protein
MPLELQIIRAQEFIRLGARGQLDLKASKAVLAVLARACWKRGINQALLDVRAVHPGIKPVFSPGDLVSLVNTFREIGFTAQQRLAVLYSFDPHQRAGMFASIARLRGWRVKAFDSFEEAVTWLSAAAPAQPEAQAELTPRKRKVPVRVLRDLPDPPTARSASRPAIQIKSITGPKPEAVPPKTRSNQGASARAIPSAARPAAGGPTREQRTQ